MDTLSGVLQFSVCAGVVVVAGTILAKCEDTTAEITKSGRLLIGSVLLAKATSLPELTVDISAIRMGAPDLVIGDLFGSCMANLLILLVRVRCSENQSVYPTASNSNAARRTRSAVDSVMPESNGK